MFLDNPNVRKGIYLVTIVLAAAAIVLKHVSSPWAAEAADAVTELVTYLAGLAGLVAAGNVTPAATPMSAEPFNPPSRADNVVGVTPPRPPALAVTPGVPPPMATRGAPKVDDFTD